MEIIFGGAEMCPEKEKKLWKKLEHKSCEKQLRELGMLSLQERSMGGSYCSLQCIVRRL